MILGAIRDLILASSDVTDLIAQRLFPVSVPQGVERPHADMRVVTTQTTNHLSGNSHSYRSNLTIDVTTLNPLLGDRIAMAMIESGVVEFKGTQSDVIICGVELESGISHFDEGVEPGSDKHIYVTTFSLDVCWARPCR